MKTKPKSKRSEGKAEEIGGAIKKNVGKLIGDEKLEAEGKLKELKGVSRQESSKAGERAKGAVEELLGAVENRVGHLIDNERMQAEGKVHELKGQARQKANLDSRA